MELKILLTYANEDELTPKQQRQKVKQIALALEEYSLAPDLIESETPSVT